MCWKKVLKVWLIIFSVVWQLAPINYPRVLGHFVWEYDDLCHQLCLQTDLLFMWNKKHFLSAGIRYPTSDPEWTYAPAAPGGPARRARLHCWNAHPQRCGHSGVLWCSVNTRDSWEGRIDKPTPPYFNPLLLIKYEMSPPPHPGNLGLTFVFIYDAFVFWRCWMRQWQLYSTTPSLCPGMTWKSLKASA